VYMYVHVVDRFWVSAHYGSWSPNLKVSQLQTNKKSSGKKHTDKSGFDKLS
jgi:hypothetical protein